jgi:hypothetical protein
MTELTATEAATRDLWQVLPLELIVSVAAILLAGGLKFAGVMP